MDRSLAFTALLEWPEFGKLETTAGTGVVTELVERFRAEPSTTLWDHYLAFRAEVGEGNLATRVQVRNFLLSYLKDTEENRAEIACILKQDGWKHTGALTEHFAGQAWDPGPESFAQANGFALSALYECHHGPHQITCPSAA